MPVHANPQTIAPATASRTKWLAVATMAIRMVSGYATPRQMHNRRRGEGMRMRRPIVRGMVRERRCAGAKGILIMVRPIRREYPK